MKIAAINNVNPNFRAKRNNNSGKDNRYFAGRFRKIITENKGRTPKLSMMEKFADLMLDKNTKEIPQSYNAVKDEFDSLSKHAQDRIMLAAKFRKDIRALTADKELLNNACKKAWNSVMKNRK